MTGINKAYFNSVTKPAFFFIIVWHKHFQCRNSIVGCVQRFKCFTACTFVFAVAPFSFKFLNMCRVAQHNVAQIHCGVGGVDFTFKTTLYKQRNMTRMVDMRVGEKDIVNFARCNRKFNVFKYIFALFHTAVNYYFFA